jgi:hypothetical protein
MRGNMVARSRYSYSGDSGLSAAICRARASAAGPMIADDAPGTLKRAARRQQPAQPERLIRWQEPERDRDRRRSIASFVSERS